MNKSSFHSFILFWFSQSVSQLGSAMTGFALSLWAYRQTGSALALSLMSFCSYLPYILISTLAGTYVDRHRKKSILLISDGIAALCTACVGIMLFIGRFEIWQIYLANTITGIMGAFQSPAAAVAIGIMVPEEKYGKASGMSSFADSLCEVVKPVLASFLYVTFGITFVIVVDLLTFLFAFLVLLFGVSITELKIPERAGKMKQKVSAFDGFLEGMEFLKIHKGLLYIMLSMALINFCSRLTYENILTPMLLDRGGSEQVVAIVSGVIGVGGILGGLLVSTVKLSKDNVKMMFLPAAFSFLFGDLLMGLGQNTVIWCIAGLAATVPIPFIMAGQKVLMYRSIPSQMQGRVFAVRNAVQYSTIPIGILLGGFLAEYVFEPFMAGNSQTAKVLGCLVGTGKGSGMAVMFLGTAVIGTTVSLVCYRSREIRKLQQAICDQKDH